jgi:hypothetical protein
MMPDTPPRVLGRHASGPGRCRATIRSSIDIQYKYE